MRRPLLATIGALAGSALAWAGLLTSAACSLSPTDSLFDRDPRAADLFLFGWLALAALGAVVGLVAASKKRQ
jgi:hypothetical protein